VKVFVQMPIDTPFKVGDIFLERGYCIKEIGADGKPVHEDITSIYLRPQDVATEEEAYKDVELP